MEDYSAVSGLLGLLGLLSECRAARLLSCRAARQQGCRGHDLRLSPGCRVMLRSQYIEGAGTASPWMV